MKVGVVGASGYVGGETIRLLVNHPEVEIVAVTSRQHAGEYLHRIQPSLKGFTDIKFSELDYDKMSSECDLVFTAVPHGTATEIVKTFYDRGTRVIDLSADFRLHNPSDYDKWYGWTHPHPNYLEKSVFLARGEKMMQRLYHVHAYGNLSVLHQLASHAPARSLSLNPQ